MQFRQILRKLCNTPKGKAKFQELLIKYRHRMTEEEFRCLEDTYYRKLPSLTVADNLSRSSSHYFNVLKTSLSKLEMLIGDVTMREIIFLV